jgi:hypothetical protein
VQWHRKCGDVKEIETLDAKEEEDITNLVVIKVIKMNNLIVMMMMIFDFYCRTFI